MYDTHEHSQIEYTIEAIDISIESFRTRAIEELEGMMLKSKDYFNPQNMLLRSAIEKLKNLK